MSVSVTSPHLFRTHDDHVHVITITIITIIIKVYNTFFVQEHVLLLLAWNLVPSKIINFRLLHLLNMLLWALIMPGKDVIHGSGL